MVGLLILCLVLIAAPIAYFSWVLATPIAGWHPAAVDVAAARRIALQRSDLPAGYSVGAPAESFRERAAAGPCTTLSGQPWLANFSSTGYWGGDALAVWSTVIILPSAHDAKTGVQGTTDPSFGQRCLVPKFAQWALANWLSCKGSRLSSAVKPLPEREYGAVGWMYSESFTCGSRTYSDTVVDEWRAVGRVSLNVIYEAGNNDDSTLFFGGFGDPVLSVGRHVLAAMTARAQSYVGQSA